MFRVAFARSTRTLTAVSQPSRTFHSTPQALKTVTEQAKEAASTVNKKVGQGLAAAIDKGEELTESTKETLGQKKDEASETAQKAGNLARQKSNQAAAGATEAKEDIKKEFKK
ncbi:hypothetical protein FRC20_006474 [Serendipita sp. 405]|nr:hypothetical protein FRC20_006474 [Serendipita sp. 405]